MCVVCAAKLLQLLLVISFEVRQLIVRALRAIPKLLKLLGVLLLDVGYGALVRVVIQFQFVV